MSIVFMLGSKLKFKYTAIAKTYFTKITHCGTLCLMFANLRHGSKMAFHEIFQKF